MVKITNRQGLEAWLKNQPREVAGLIAARAAMRALPTLKGAYDQRYENADNLTLATFHSCAISWIAVAGDDPSPTQPTYSRYSTHGAYSVYVAAAEAATTTRAFNAIAKAANAVAYAANTANVPAAMWRIVQEDANGIDNGVFVEDLARTPLVSLLAQPERRSVDFIAPASLSALLDDWTDLKSILLDRNQDWDVWIDWYQDRLDGKPQNAAFEKALLALTDEEWEQEPEIVNAWLKALMREELFEQLIKPMAQGPAAFRFTSSQGVLTAHPYRTSTELLEPDHTEIRALCEQADFLSRMIDERGLDNRPFIASLADTLSRLRDHLTLFAPGALKMHATLLDSHAKYFESREAIEELTPEIVARAMAFQSVLNDFLKQFNEMREISEAQRAIAIEDDALPAIQQVQAAIEDYAKTSGTSDQTVIAALKTGDKEIEELETQQKNSLNPDHRSILDRTIRSLIAQKLLTTRNYLSKLLESATNKFDNAYHKVSQFFAPSFEEVKKNLPPVAGHIPNFGLYLTILAIVKDPMVAAVVFSVIAGGGRVSKELAAVVQVIKKRISNQ